MRIKVTGIVFAALVLALSLALPAEADTIYVAIKGTKQGQFKGEAPQPNLVDKIMAHKFLYEVSSPRDIASGQASGKRQHKPMVIVKEWGAASPQLFQALVTNELLPEVLVDFVGVDQRTGQEMLTHRIRLTNAMVTNILHTMEEPVSGAKHGVALNRPHLEEISFIFQRIELEDLIGKTVVSDDFRGPR